MLSKGMQNEQDQRINSILEKLTTLTFVPNPEGIQNIEKYLHKVGMSFQDLQDFSSDELNAHLKKFNFGWDHFERFADLLLVWSSNEALLGFKEKAKEMYLYIQSESKSFSFEIMNKINQL